MRSPPGSKRRRIFALLISASAHGLVVAALTSLQWSRPDPGAPPLQVVWITARWFETSEPRDTEQPRELPPEVPTREPSPPPADESPPEDDSPESDVPLIAAPTDAQTSPPGMPGPESEQSGPPSERATDTMTSGGTITWQVLEDTRERVFAELRRERASERSYRYLGRWRAGVGDAPLLSPAPSLFEAEARARAGLALAETDGSLTRWINDDCYAISAAADVSAPYVLRNPAASIACTRPASPRSNLFEDAKPTYLRESAPPQRAGEPLAGATD